MSTYKNGHTVTQKPIEYRCEYCGKLHFKGYLPPGAFIELMCPRSNCGRLTVYKGVQEKSNGELVDKEIVYNL